MLRPIFSYAHARKDVATVHREGLLRGCVANKCNEQGAFGCGRCMRQARRLEQDSVSIHSHVAARGVVTQSRHSNAQRLLPYQPIPRRVVGADQTEGWSDAGNHPRVLCTSSGVVMHHAPCILRTWFLVGEHHFGIPNVHDSDSQLVVTHKQSRIALLQDDSHASTGVAQSGNRLQQRHRETRSSLPLTVDAPRSVLARQAVPRRRTLRSLRANVQARVVHVQHAVSALEVHV